MQSFKRIKQAYEYWKERMRSRVKKMSEGAQQLARIIPFARKENWRRDDTQQRGHNPKTKK